MAARAVRGSRPARRLGSTVDMDDVPLRIPINVTKRFAAGWDTHIPLNALTDKACRDAERKQKVKGASTVTVDTSDNGVKFKHETEEFSTEGEKDMTTREWQQAWPRHLQLIKRFFPEEWELWVMHHERIANKESAMGDRWDIWLRYDIRVRELSTHHHLDPSLFHRDLYDEAVDDWKIDRELRENPSSLRGADGKSSFRPLDKPGKSKEPSSDRICIICGRGGHGYKKCTASKAVDGKPLYVTDIKKPCNSEGNAICLQHNVNECRRESGSCTYSHKCTLCGTSSHSAGNCPRLRRN
jgi:hypothetical protein